MNFWLSLNNEDQLQELDEKSFHLPVFIFKHSTSCSISQIIKFRFETNWVSDYPVYLLDLHAHRALSKAIEERYQVKHESPQILVIQNGMCTFDESHLDIVIEEIRSFLLLEEGGKAS